VLGGTEHWFRGVSNGGNVTIVGRGGTNNGNREEGLGVTSCPSGCSPVVGSCGKEKSSRKNLQRINRRPVGLRLSVLSTSAGKMDWGKQRFARQVKAVSYV